MQESQNSKRTPVKKAKGALLTAERIPVVLQSMADTHCRFVRKPLLPLAGTATRIRLSHFALLKRERDVLVALVGDECELGKTKEKNPKLTKLSGCVAVFIPLPSDMPEAGLFQTTRTETADPYDPTSEEEYERMLAPKRRRQKVTCKTLKPEFESAIRERIEDPQASLVVLRVNEAISCFGQNGLTDKAAALSETLSVAWPPAGNANHLYIAKAISDQVIDLF